MLKITVNVLYRIMAYYFFACIEYLKPVTDYYGAIEKYEKELESNVFSLDHYPSKKEIISNVIGSFDTSSTIISYSLITKEQYDAFCNEEL
jgi:hypothetical protein